MAERTFDKADTPELTGTELLLKNDDHRHGNHDSRRGWSSASSVLSSPVLSVQASEDDNGGMSASIEVRNDASCSVDKSVASGDDRKEARQQHGERESRMATLADLEWHISQLEHTVREMSQEQRTDFEKLQERIFEVISCRSEACSDNFPLNMDSNTDALEVEMRQREPKSPVLGLHNVKKGDDVLDIPSGSEGNKYRLSEGNKLAVLGLSSTASIDEHPQSNRVSSYSSARGSTSSSSGVFSASFFEERGHHFFKKMDQIKNHRASQRRTQMFTHVVTPEKPSWRASAVVPADRKSSIHKSRCTSSGVEEKERDTFDGIADEAIPDVSAASYNSMATETRHGILRFSAHDQAKRALHHVNGPIVPDDMNLDHGLYGARFHWADKVINNRYFDAFAAVLLLSNSVFIGWQVDLTASSPDGTVNHGHQVIDLVYAVLFVLELLLRFFGHGFADFFFGEDRSWNTFDLIVVIVGSIETVLSVLVTDDGVVAQLSNLSVVRTVRIARIVRIVRVIRLMRFFRSLRILITAIFNTVKSCFWTSLLLCIILYIFGVMFAQAASDHLHEVDADVLGMSAETEAIRIYFGTLPRSIYTCFKAILGGVDWEPIAQALSDIGAYYVAVFLLMVVFVFLAVMNVISGLFLQSALEHAQADINEQIHQADKKKKQYEDMFEQLYSEIDRDSDGCLTLVEFERSLGNGSMETVFRAIGIDANDAWTLFKLLDIDNNGFVTRERFVEGCWELKGNAKSIHISQLRYELEWLMDSVLELATFIEQSFNNLNMNGARDGKRKNRSEVSRKNTLPMASALTQTRQSILPMRASASLSSRAAGADARLMSRLNSRNTATAFEQNAGTAHHAPTSSWGLGSHSGDEAAGHSSDQGPDRSLNSVSHQPLPNELGARQCS